MSFGPIELLVVRFPREGTGDVGPALRSMVEAGLIRVVDALVVSRAADGTITSREIVELDDHTLATLDPVVDKVTGFLSERDVQWLADKIEPGSIAGLLLFEHVWATRFSDAVADAGGEVLMSERVPSQTIEGLAPQAVADGTIVSRDGPGVTGSGSG
jgi:hypothetical protein